MSNSQSAPDGTGDSHGVVMAQKDKKTREEQLHTI